MTSYGPISLFFSSDHVWTFFPGFLKKSSVKVLAFGSCRCETHCRLVRPTAQLPSNGCFYAFVLECTISEHSFLATFLYLQYNPKSSQCHFFHCLLIQIFRMGSNERCQRSATSSRVSFAWLLYEGRQARTCLSDIRLVAVGVNGMFRSKPVVTTRDFST